MEVITIRLNNDEQIILNKLIAYYDAPQSSILKKAMYDMYENIADRELLDKIEIKRTTGKLKGVTAEEIINNYEKKNK